MSHSTQSLSPRLPENPPPVPTKPSCWSTCFLTVIIKRIGECVRDIFMAFVNIFRCSNPEDLKNKKIQELELKNAQLQEQTQRTPEETAAKIAAQKDLITTQDERIKELERAQAELLRSATQSGNANDQLAALNAEFQALKAAHEKLLKEKAEMVSKQAYEAIQKQLSDLQAAQKTPIANAVLEAANTQIAALRQQLAEQSKVQTTQADNISAFQQQLATANKAKTEAESKVKLIEQQLSVAQKTIQELQQAAASNKGAGPTNTQALEQELTRLRQELKTIEERTQLAVRKEADVALKELEEQVDRISAKASKFELENAQLKDAAKERGKSAGKISAQDKALQGRVTEAEAKLRQEQDKLAAVNKELAATKQSVAELTQRLASAATPTPAGGDSSKEIHDLKTKIKELEQQVTLKQKTIELRGDVTALGIKIVGLEMYNEKLKEALTAGGLEVPVDPNA